MNQLLNVTLSIPIPDDHILIHRVELEKLEQETLQGKLWTMKDLEERTGHRADWIKEKILYVPALRKKLDVEHGGFVFYPKSKGQPWNFHAAKMADFLDKHYHIILGGY